MITIQLQEGETIKIIGQNNIQARLNRLKGIKEE